VKRAEILSKLAEISATPPTSLLLQFQQGKVNELVKAFDASVSEFVSVIPPSMSLFVWPS